MATLTPEREPTVSLWRQLCSEVNELRQEVDQHRATLNLEPRPARFFPREPPAALERTCKSGGYWKSRRADGSPQATMVP